MGNFGNRCRYANFKKDIKARVQDNHQVPRTPQEQQLLDFHKSELKIVRSLPKKQFDKVKKKGSHSSKKRKAASEIVRSQKRQKCNPEICELSQFSSITVEESTSVPAEALEMYENVERLFKDLDSVIESFHGEQENDPRADIPSIRGMKIVKGKLVVKMPTTNKRRNVCAKFRRRMKKYAKQLKKSLNPAIAYLDIIKSVLDSVPVYSNYVRNLKKKLDKANKSYLANPIHKECKTVLRQMKLVQKLVLKYDKLYKIKETTESVVQI